MKKIVFPQTYSLLFRLESLCLNQIGVTIKLCNKFCDILYVYIYLQVHEETGFDISTMINKDDFLENRLNEQLTRLYIIKNVPLDTKFQPKTRKEIKVCLHLFCVYNNCLNGKYMFV